MLRIAFLYGLSLALLGTATAQDLPDSSYVSTFPDHIATRLYFSRKYTKLQIEEENSGLGMAYDPSSSLNLGVGATVGGFTLNLGYGFGFLNPDEGKGKTTYLDLQSHMYKRRYVTDIFAQFYQGMYLNNTRQLDPEFPAPYYLRPDLRIVQLGMSMQKVLNAKKFSYAAPLVQNEVQRKSAGSFLLGAKIVLLNAAADSSFVPHFVEAGPFGGYEQVRRISSLQWGPSAGYAYSWVFLKHWFITGSLNLNFLLGPTHYQTENGQGDTQWKINTAGTIRLAMGYNSAKTYVGLQLVEDATTAKRRNHSVSNTFSTGNVRFSIVKRLQMGPKLKSFFDKLPF